jgi:hypothetical protein
VLPTKTTVTSVTAMCFIWVHSADFAALSQVICFITGRCIVEHAVVRDAEMLGLVHAASSLWRTRYVLFCSVVAVAVS